MTTKTMVGLLGVVLLSACGSGDITTAEQVEVTESSFECILDGTKVGNFYVANLLGDDAASVAVARGEAPQPYPVGTLVQLFPLEAMVKREAGFSDETGDWEFFFLSVSASGTEIATRGKEDTVNAFGGNCFTCHALARDNDFICGRDNGCDPLPSVVDDEFITSLQEGDPRCSN